jgi:ribokinase
LRSNLRVETGGIMTIYNLGSINIDHSYHVPALPRPGETVAATALVTGLGGKGANQSIAIARAGGKVAHIGAVGPEGGWTVEMLQAAGVDTGAVRVIDVPTGHAMITVDAAAENAIVLLPGANTRISNDQIAAALQSARPGDWLLLQNETNGGIVAARLAREKGMQVAYCAAPFDAAAVAEVLPFVDLLSVNEGEAAQLRAELPEATLANCNLLVTYGARGAAYIAPDQTVKTDAFKVDPVDTTGAGDTFLGYALAGLDSGMAVEVALRRAAAAAALQVTRPGAAEAIPLAQEVADFLARQG